MRTKHPRYKEIKAGDRYNKWEVLENRNPEPNCKHILCRCSCGTEAKVQIRHLLKGNSTQCRKCMYQDISTAMKKPGRDTVSYRVWKGIASRCKGHQPLSQQYKGMEYCSFEEFLAEMGERPNGKLSVDRIDNTKGYIKGNMRWATDTEQANNTGKTVFFYKGDGSKLCLTAVCREYNLKYNTARDPRYRGLDLGEFIEEVRKATLRGKGGRRPKGSKFQELVSPSKKRVWTGG